MHTCILTSMEGIHINLYLQQALSQSLVMMGFGLYKAQLIQQSRLLKYYCVNLQGMTLLDGRNKLSNSEASIFRHKMFSEAVS